MTPRADRSILIGKEAPRVSRCERVTSSARASAAWRAQRPSAKERGPGLHSPIGSTPRRFGRSRRNGFLSATDGVMLAPRSKPFPISEQCAEPLSVLRLKVRATAAHERVLSAEVVAEGRHRRTLREVGRAVARVDQVADDGLRLCPSGSTFQSQLTRAQGLT
jgi:hypothetical protein